MLVKKAGTILLNLETKKIGLVYRKKDKSYTFPKGHLEKGETLKECAIRETEEETLRTNHLLINKEIDVLRYTTPLGENVENYMYIAVDDGPSSKDISMCDREIFEWIEYNDVENKLIFSDLKLLCNNINQKNQWHLVWLLVNSKGDTGDVQFKCNLSIWWCYVIIWEDRRRRSMRLVKLYTVVQNDLLDAFVKYINSNKKSLN